MWESKWQIREERGDTKLLKIWTNERASNENGSKQETERWTSLRRVAGINRRKDRWFVAFKV